jgi:ParB-like chromosome segregation protein Spo0J
MSRRQTKSGLKLKSETATAHKISMDAFDEPFRLSSNIRPQRTIAKKYSAARSKAAHPARQIENVKITEIEISEDWCARGGQEIELLTSSFVMVGQRVPISLSKGPNGLYRIIDGWDRYEAAVRLDMPTVLAEVIEGPSYDLPFIQIAQNFHRKRHDVLRRAEADVEWMEAFRRQATQVADPLGGRQPSDRCYSKASEATGISVDRWRRSELIASIPEASKKLIRELRLNDNQSALLEIATTELSGQIEKIRWLAQPSESKPKRTAAKPTPALVASAPLVRTAGCPSLEEASISEQEVLELEPPPCQSGTSLAIPPKDEDPNRGAGAPAVSVLRLEQNQTKPDTSEVTLESESDKYTLSIGGPSSCVPELPAHNEPATTSQHALSKAQAFVDFPALPEFLKRADVETELKKLKEEYLGSRLRKILIDAPYTAGERFIKEVFLPDFQKASQEALAVAGDGGQS